MANRPFFVALALTLTLAPMASSADMTFTARERGVLLAFQHMVGVDGPFLQDGTPIGGVPGDEQPWEVKSAIGRLGANGDLLLRVRGVVFANDPSVPPELRGINDETQFRAAVVCMTEQNGQAAQRAVFTQGFPATRTGDSLMHAHLTLPSPCIAPIVLVLAGSEDKWFAVNGFEAH